MGYVGSSDRNFYDRCYFNAHNRSGGDAEWAHGQWKGRSHCRPPRSDRVQGMVQGGPLNSGPPPEDP
jgi:hypothetical protein